MREESDVGLGVSRQTLGWVAGEFAAADLRLHANAGRPRRTSFTAPRPHAMIPAPVQ